jgi:hypothetical protein
MFATENLLFNPNIYAYIYTTSLDFGQHKLIYKERHLVSPEPANKTRGSK